VAGFSIAERRISDVFKEIVSGNPLGALNVQLPNAALWGSCQKDTPLLGNNPPGFCQNGTILPSSFWDHVSLT